MNTLAVIQDQLLVADTAELANNIRRIIGPLLALAIGIFSLKFLTGQQISKFLGFVLMAILVLVIFYSPEILENFSRSVGEETKQIQW